MGAASAIRFAARAAAREGTLEVRTRIATPRTGQAGSPALPPSHDPRAGTARVAPTPSGRLGHSFASIAVTPQRPQVQRADVQITEMSSQVRALDGAAPMSPAVQALVTKALVDMRPPAETGTAEEVYPDAPAPEADPYADLDE